MHYLHGKEFDPYPFILLNLLFSTQAAYAAPLILFSQNRTAERDRIKAQTSGSGRLPGPVVRAFSLPGAVDKAL